MAANACMPTISFDLRLSTERALELKPLGTNPLENGYVSFTHQTTFG